MPKRVYSNLKRPVQPTYIRAWRKAANLSQDALVERVREELPAFSKSTLSRLENAKQNYNQPMLEAIARALNCTPADLLMRDPDNSIWSLMDTLKSLSPDQQKQAAEILQIFRKAS